MANFARSFKSPSLLSPRYRPSMPGRSLSASSDKSYTAAAGNSMDDSDFALSAPGTPYLGPPEDEEGFAASEDHHAPSTPGFSRNRSRPIAIELPTNRSRSGTSPQELSARGDLAGGYFPFHEDPKTRVHRPHPFHHVPKSPRGHAPNTVTAEKEKPTLTPEPKSMRPATAAPATTYSHTPVVSYMPAGFNEHPLPMGKYYPSNWEQRHKGSSSRPATSDSVVTNSMPANGTSEPSPMATQDSEVRRKLQQYQRDMLAQTSLAASQLVGNSLSRDAARRNGAVPRGHTIHDLRPAGYAKPSAPRLMPLGSPGPVTPMELESSSTSYLGSACTDEGTLSSPPTATVPHTT